LAITFKSNRAFAEFTNALLALITNTQIVPDPSRVKGQKHLLEGGSFTQHDKTQDPHQDLWKRQRFQ
jgi:hypothetical protein